MYKITFISLFMLALLTLLPAQETELTAPEISARVQSFLQGDSIHAIIGVQTKDVNNNGLSIVVEYFGLKNKEGELLSLASFLQPSAIKNTRFLLIQKFNALDEQWIYIPATRQVTRMATSARDQEFMGTDFTFEDLSSRDLTRFNVRLLEDMTIDGEECWQLETTAKPGVEWIYSRVVDVISKTHFYPLRAYLYAKNGELLKQGRIGPVKKVQGYWTAMGATMENVQTKHKTIIKIAKVEYDVAIPKRMFTPAYLKSGKF